VSFDDDMGAAAQEELDRAVTLGWRAISQHTPWGDTFEGFTPQGRAVCFERTYLWEGDAGGDIRVEVMVYEPQAYEDGVKAIREIRKVETLKDGETP
jgi:hypothetical protein